VHQDGAEDSLLAATDLFDRAMAGDPRALARIISQIEDRSAGVEQVLARMHRSGRRAHIVGVTGPAGTGKSTLVAQLIREFRRRGRTLGVIAVDPTSPFTGGAVLGDRVRMQEFASDPGVFIRSMATRGHLGGLARATAEVVRVLESTGRQMVLVETVGAGQSEVEIARTADTTVVVEVPGLGDDVQAIKAGLMEIADIFAVNKADIDNADRVVLALKLALHLGPASPWEVPILKTVATTNVGIEALADAVDRHFTYLADSQQLAGRERERVRVQILDLFGERVQDRLLQALGETGLQELVARVASRETDPYAAADELLGHLHLPQ
jgi:LAO/AO transport system kinase